LTTILFFDDQRLNLCYNVRRRLGHPQLIEESIYRDPYVNTAWGYPSVFRVPAIGTWRLLYQGWESSGKRVPLVAESDDGLHWSPRDTAEVHISERVLPHQVLPLERFGEWSACYVDKRAEPEERIKGFVVYHTAKNYLKSRLWVSPDGIRWSLKEGVEWQRTAPDPAVGAFWNETRKTYVLTTRPDWTDRRIAVVETPDWQIFTEPELALQADALDNPLAELYGMPVFPYEGYYIGFLWLFHPAPQVHKHSPHKFLDGHVDCQLTYSLNGWHFQRGLREPLIPNGEPGAPDSGCVYPSSMMESDDGNLWIYASACTHEHGYMPAQAGSIVTYRLRRDGFVYLESGGGIATVGTRPLYWQAGDLELNVQSPAGETKTQLTDPQGKPLPGYSFEDCIPFSGDSTVWRPRWKDEKTPAAQAGKVIRVEVSLRNARLYAIRGDFIPLVASHSWRFSQNGEVPTPRPGF